MLYILDRLTAKPGIGDGKKKVTNRW